MDGHLHGSSGIGHWRSMVSIGSDINRIVAWTQRCSFAYHADEAAEVDALNDISCAIPQGEIAILCGQSGCGKTTYTRLLNGLIPGFYSGDLQGIHMTCGIRAGLAPVEAMWDRWAAYSRIRRRSISMLIPPMSWHSLREYGHVSRADSATRA